MDGRGRSGKTVAEEGQARSGNVFETLREVAKPVLAELKKGG
jgi:hypothetical protein